MKWIKLSKQQRDELVAEQVFKWFQIDSNWYTVEAGSPIGPMSLPSFSTDDDAAWQILKHFDAWQVTKKFPIQYRVFISSNEHVGLTKSLAESICIAALRASGIDILH